MVGKHVSLFVYARGEAARDLPYTLWQMIEEASDWPRIFWANDYPPARIPQGGDLSEWCNYLHYGKDEKVFCLVVDRFNGDIIGLIWASDVVAERAFMAGWMTPKMRGKPHAREAVHLFVDFLHNTLHIPVIVAVTPWIEARNLVKRCGFKDICFIPNTYRKDVWLLQHVQTRSVLGDAPRTSARPEEELRQRSDTKEG